MKELKNLGTVASTIIGLLLIFGPQSGLDLNFLIFMGCYMFVICIWSPEKSNQVVTQNSNPYYSILAIVIASWIPAILLTGAIYSLVRIII